MPYTVYILYSPKLSKYYVGETHNVAQRLERHNSGYYTGSWSSKGQPWEMYLVLICRDRVHAQKVERHIKRMKSKKYIENLKKYEEMRQKLLHLYSQ